MARECPRGKDTIHCRNGKHGWKNLAASMTEQNNMRINNAMRMNEDGWKYTNNKGKQKIMLKQEWL